jgi:hypothetical protein
MRGLSSRLPQHSSGVKGMSDGPRKRVAVSLEELTYSSMLALVELLTRKACLLSRRSWSG